MTSEGSEARAATGHVGRDPDGRIVPCAGLAARFRAALLEMSFEVGLRSVLTGEDVEQITKALDREAAPLMAVTVAPDGSSTMRAVSDLAARIALLSPKPGDTIVAWVPDDGAQDLDGGKTLQEFMIEVLAPIAKDHKCSALALPIGFDVNALSVSELASMVGFVRTSDVATRLRARAAELTYTGDGATATVLREEAERVERGDLA